MQKARILGLFLSVLPTLILADSSLVECKSINGGDDVFTFAEEWATHRYADRGDNKPNIDNYVRSGGDREYYDYSQSPVYSVLERKTDTQIVKLFGFSLAVTIAPGFAPQTTIYSVTCDTPLR